MEKRAFDLFDEAYWRARAVKIRALAEMIPDAQCRKQALEIAENYDKLAERSAAHAQKTGRGPGRDAP
jgi:hypothetical protein